ncbi:hypothetical protein SESBI_23997 [Sesbania bispinosa]|nr:hypothetical protein SESBI_23997 [Sesbania bispinosa]
MKFYISAKGIKRVTISNSAGAGKGSAKTTAAASASPVAASSGRRISLRTVLPVVLVLGIVLPFLFVRVAILVLESATFCSSLGISPFHFFYFVILIFPPLSLVTFYSLVND